MSVHLHAIQLHAGSEGAAERVLVFGRNRRSHWPRIAVFSHGRSNGDPPKERETRCSAPSDLHEYLRAFSAESYEISEFRLARCDCGSEQFSLEVEDDDGVARRTCAACKKPHFNCDSEENWSADLKTRKYECVTCRSKSAPLTKTTASHFRVSSCRC